ncbi:MAG: dicarboxylate/amino acid:cation symporter [Sphaerochaetaceae bacterium]|nr:dicarboxylate/amino acid:cation symporter [Sphaerochaetaceae bacterium]MDD3941758.1 dicarboxylate/amino acid:cation symporter [Sphaerochaetaceae bacterium]MDX9939400.1 dicarboxylate/amino acid:cation symporter [Sphaerochaetaceae bacterium]
MAEQKKAPVKKGLLGWYFNFNLLYRILIGLVLGAILGIALGEKILWIAPFGALFVRLLKMIMMPIILSTLIVGAASISPATLGKVGIRVVLFYLLTSAFAVFVGLVMGSVFQPSAEMAALSAEAAGKAAASQPVSQVLLNIVPTSIAQAVVNEVVLQVIFFAIIFGIGISYLKISKDERLVKAGEALYMVFDGTAEVMMRMVTGIMQYAPIGVLALVAEVFAKQGSKVAGSLAVVTIACFAGYLIHVVLVYGGLLKFGGKLSIRRFFRDAKDPFITAFVTRSSNGTLPVTIEAAKNLGVPKDIYAFSLPLGATINMDGTAIYQGVCAIFISLTVTGHNFTLGQMGIIILTATLASIGTAGVPGAGALMLLMVLEAVGLPVVAGTAVAGAYAMILGIDAILDMGRTALNVTGDLTCTTVVAKGMKQLDLEKWA